jgi:hypothetical protein
MLRLGGKCKERTSFCDQKEGRAPREQKTFEVYDPGRSNTARSGAKVFWFFFSKKNFFLPFIPYPIALCGDRMAV